MKTIEKENIIEINNECVEDILRHIVTLYQDKGSPKNKKLHTRYSCISSVFEHKFAKYHGYKDIATLCLPVDCYKDNVAINLKNFNMEGLSYEFEKIMERNQLSETIRKLPKEEIPKFIAYLYNKSIEEVKKKLDVKVLYYLCGIIDNKNNIFNIHQYHYEPINIENISIINSKNPRTKNSTKFTDGIDEFNFDISKTLLNKKFDTHQNIIKSVSIDDFITKQNCSKCKYPIFVKNRNFCPYCGISCHSHTDNFTLVC